VSALHFGMWRRFSNLRLFVGVISVEVTRPSTG
jgi:hypothetical protein